ncbi:TetR family transcriptional regulator [Telmatospirillum siberiense]|uniref:TetR family transcriptional regulator n=1 Tax=Telmatospirillum siberiense TaxID=382514 RepID=UPI0018EB935D|nr:TetR family transcriptional regulator [Telmatospirillum siberiense]
MRAAETLFLQKGYSAVSLEEVAAAAGVTRGAVHWHFVNKQGLLFAIRDEMQLPMRDLAEQLSLDRACAPLDALGDVITGTFTRLQADPRQRALLKVLHQLDFAASDDETDDGTIFRQQLQASLFKIFDVIDRKGELPAPWTSQSAALALSVVLNGLVNEWVRGKADFELIPDASAIVQTLLDAWRVPAR